MLFKYMKVYLIYRMRLKWEYESTSLTSYIHEHTILIQSLNFLDGHTFVGIGLGYGPDPRLPKELRMDELCVQVYSLPRQYQAPAVYSMTTQDHYRIV